MSRFFLLLIFSFFGCGTHGETLSLKDTGAYKFNRQEIESRSWKDYGGTASFQEMIYVELKSLPDLTLSIYQMPGGKLNKNTLDMYRCSKFQSSFHFLAHVTRHVKGESLSLIGIRVADHDDHCVVSSLWQTTGNSGDRIVKVFRYDGEKMTFLEGYGSEIKSPGRSKTWKNCGKLVYKDSVYKGK